MALETVLIIGTVRYRLVSSPGELKERVASLEPFPNVVMVVAPTGPPIRAKGATRTMVKNIADKVVTFLLLLIDIPPKGGWVTIGLHVFFK
jgi:hypothetical protein